MKKMLKRLCTGFLALVLWYTKVVTFRSDKIE